MDSSTKRYVCDSLKTMIEIPSVTGTIGEKKMANYIIEELDRFGFNSQVYDNNVMFKLREPKEGKPTLALIGHTDTVPGEDHQYIAKEKDGYIIGRGSVDMKQGLAIILTIAKLISEGKITSKEGFGLMGIAYRSEEVKPNGEVGDNGITRYLVPKKILTNEIAQMAIFLEPLAPGLGAMGRLAGSVEIKPDLQQNDNNYSNYNLINSSVETLAPFIRKIPQELVSDTVALEIGREKIRMDYKENFNITSIDQTPECVKLNIDYRNGPGSNEKCINFCEKSKNKKIVRARKFYAGIIKNNSDTTKLGSQDLNINYENMVDFEFKLSGVPRHGSIADPNKNVAHKGILVLDDLLKENQRIDSKGYLLIKRIQTEDQLSTTSNSLTAQVRYLYNEGDNPEKIINFVSNYLKEEKLTINKPIKLTENLKNEYARKVAPLKMNVIKGIGPGPGVIDPNNKYTQTLLSLIPEEDRNYQIIPGWSDMVTLLLIPRISAINYGVGDAHRYAHAKDEQISLKCLFGGVEKFEGIASA